MFKKRKEFLSPRVHPKIFQVEPYVFYITLQCIESDSG